MSKSPRNESLESRLSEVEAALREHTRAELRFRECEEGLRGFGEASSDVLWIRDAETLQWEYLTAAFETIYGLSRAEALAGDNFSSWIDLIVAEDRQRVEAQIQRIRDGERVTFEYRICRPKDGGIRWLRDADFPIRDDTGKVAHIGGVGRDITLQKQAEEARQLRFAELQHQVRNTLAVIRSIVRRTMEKSISLEEANAHLEGRINAFARVQAAITRNPAGGIDLAAIIAEELRAAGAKEGDGLTISGPQQALHPKAAETIGLAVHELATNALKYGALSHRAGSVDVQWRIEGDALRFAWSESGMHSLKSSERQGFGSEVLQRSLPYELGATVNLRVEPTGLHFEAEIPLSAIQTREHDARSSDQ
ncbi:HWE histidine kinase domain-containing protein [Mesorhizobium sp.]|uniref:sensor histidine kinase n=1 Tax=Mesorhizobium sp. TaxID=1871066 RepID=UPI000F75139C|nr:HWE histidine kinase domain-containing protein [Mesorhizobium sp.]AZO56387.1 PAS domain S-box protein [Mesorhizobium sp. M8A.F.Ca.ET.057.01.1.1]RWE48725.1 MAG: PAS domain S-box protein [Mesorhizobium sp.]